MSKDTISDEVHFTQGYRQDALKVAIEMVRNSGRSAELVVCRDIPGHHTGGEDCFCDPRVITIHTEDLQ